MTAAVVAGALRGRAKPGGGFLCRCPLPQHGKGRGDRNPSLSVDDGEGGRLLVRCFSGCNGADVLGELRSRGLLTDHDCGPRPAGRVNGHDPRPAPAATIKPHAESLKIWRAARPATEDTLTARYLRGRAITGPIPPTIRYHPNVVHAPTGLPFPCMVAAIQAPDRRIVAVHLTYLTADGRGKANVTKPKLFPKGACLGTGALRLAAAADEIGIAEGVEDGLSAAALTGLPVWCALGVSRIASVAVPNTVTTLDIFAQNDPADSEARKAIERAADTFAGQGRRVVVRRPPTAYKDWNAWHQAGAPEKKS